MKNQKHLPKMINDLVTTGMCCPIVVYGTGRRTTYNDYTDRILEVIRIDAVEFGNDAPRGGATGDFIKLKKF